LQLIDTAVFKIKVLSL